MSWLWKRVFGHSDREDKADGVIQLREEDHQAASRSLDKQVRSAEKAARQSQTAAHTLLRRLGEDTPE